MADFINTLQDIRGVDYDLNAPGEASTSSDAVSRQTGGIWKRIKDKEVNIVNTNKATNDIKGVLWGSDPLIGSEGTVLSNIHNKNMNVNTKHSEVVEMNSNVSAINIELLGEDGESGKYLEMTTLHDTVVEKEALVSPHYESIDTIGTDMYDSSTSKIKVVGKDLLSDSSKLSTIGADMLDADSILVKLGTDIDADNSILHVVGDDLVDANSKLATIGNDLLDANSKVIELATDLQDTDSKVGKVYGELQTDKALYIINADLVKTGNDGDSDEYSHIKHAFSNSVASATSATASEEASDMAQKWAGAGENVEVDNNEYSAKHYSIKAAAVVGDISDLADAAKESEENAKTSEDNAKESENSAEDFKNKADLFANASEDTEVETDKYSAKHYSLKAEGSKSAAEDAESAAATYRAEAKDSRDAAKDSQDLAKTSEDNAANSEDLADKYANAAKDTEVETGKYSAKHYSAVAEDHSDAASASETNAKNSEDNAKTSEDAAKSSEDASADSEMKASKWANEDRGTEVESGKYSAKHYSSYANDYMTEASDSRDDAATSEENAKTSEDNAKVSEDKANLWADKAVDEEVEPGKYSAKHHSTKASDSATAAKTSEDNSKISEDNASASEDKAAKWASEAEDVEVETDKYSASHYSIKASDSASVASTSETNAKTSEDNAKTSEDNAKASEDNASTSETNAKTSEDNAKTSETNSSNSESLASEWADKAVDEEITDHAGKYSAKHHSAKASDSATIATNKAADSSDSADASEASRVKANKWADEAVDTEVEDGKYSSKHHASKAGDSASAASTSETNAKSSEDAAKSSEDNAKTSEDNAKTSEDNAADSETRADEYANKDEDVEVVSGKYSSKHYSIKSSGSADAASTSESNAKTSEDNAKTSEDNAKTSEDNAAGSEDLADKYANTAKDTEVDTGKYSAKHYKEYANDYMDTAKTHRDDASTYADNSASSASDASDYADDSKAYRDELTSLTAEASSLAEGEDATASYDSGAGKLSLGIPKGDRGEKGDPFKIDATGINTDRADYNDQSKGYTFLSTNGDLDKEELVVDGSNFYGTLNPDSDGISWDASDDNLVLNKRFTYVLSISNMTTGSLLLNEDDSALYEFTGDVESYSLTITVHNTDITLKGLDSFDGDVTISVKEYREPTSVVFFKTSDDDGDYWSEANRFGVGDKGEIGVSISTIAFKSTTDASGDPAQLGATDTYRISLTDGTTKDYDVVNGKEYFDDDARAAVVDATMTFTNKVVDDITNTIGANHIHLKVKPTEDVLKGNLLTVTGFNTTDNAIEVEIVNNNTEMVIGMASDGILSGDIGTVINEGILFDIDTSAFSQGDVVYSKGDGDFTTTKPAGYYQTLGMILRSDADHGIVYVDCNSKEHNLDNVKNIDTTDASNISAGTLSDDRLPDTISSDVTGNSATTDKLSTAVNVTLTGKVTGTVSFDGSADVNIDTVVYEYSNTTADITAEARNYVFVDTTDAEVTVTMPADPVNGDTIYVTDSKGTFDTNNCTIDGNGKKVMTYDTVELDEEGLEYKLIYNGTEWRIV